MLYHFSYHNSQHSYRNNIFGEGNDKYNWEVYLLETTFGDESKPAACGLSPVLP